MVDFSILLRCSRHHRLPMMVQMMQAQTCPPEDMCVGVDLGDSGMSQGDFYSLYPEIFDSRVKLTFFENDPAGYMLNRLYEMANGDYICVWDDDDFYYNNYLNRTRHVIEERNMRLVAHAPSHRWFDGRKELRYKPDDALPEYRSSIQQSSLCFYKYLHPGLPWDDEAEKNEDTHLLKDLKEAGLRPYVITSLFVKGFYEEHLSDLKESDWYKNTKHLSDIESERDLLDFLNLTEVDDVCS